MDYQWTHGEGNGNPLQYSCLENPTDRGARQATVHGVAKSRTRLSERTVWRMVSTAACSCGLAENSCEGAAQNGTSIMARSQADHF